MRSYAFTLLSYFSLSCAFSQGLEHVPPVLKNELPVNDTSSFILSATDVHRMFGAGSQRYSNTLEIFDARTPWPPRWFTTIPLPEGAPEDSKIRLDLMYDARIQRDYFTYYRLKSFANDDDDFKDAEFNGFIICNKKMEAIDTIKSNSKLVLDPHDFRINEKGERMALATMDTLLDLRKVSGKKSDSSVLASVTVIVIFNSTDKEVFRWNSAAALGVGSAHYSDVNHAAFFKKKNRDWSHGTGALWDSDGDILYCLKNVGLGKISRKDGHIIWRLDRNKIPLISGHDTLAFYSPHDFEQLNDTGLYRTYSVLSAGDAQHPGMYGLIFKVNKQTSKISFDTKKQPDAKVTTRGSGSFDIARNGDYLLSYGMYLQNNVGDYHDFMEWHNRTGKIYAKYKVPAYVFVYKVHQLNDWSPPRPVVINKSDSTLIASGTMSDWVWYQLSGPDNVTAKRVGEGGTLKVVEPGNYCVAGKYGIGYSVSLPVTVKAGK
ncbi:MAG: hypothetical protein JWO06_2354 [Bacteroidota bacterium]|nr:hypothetical protein [Bacteroidota bacterium]